MRPPPGAVAANVKLVEVVAPLTGAVTVGAVLLSVTAMAGDTEALQPEPSQSAAVSACEPLAVPQLNQSDVAVPETTATGAPIGAAST